MCLLHILFTYKIYYVKIKRKDIAYENNYSFDPELNVTLCTR